MDFRATLSSLSLFPLLSFTLLSANPKGMEAVHGQAMSGTTDNILHVITSESAIINWDSFSIAPGEITRFIQPSEHSQVLNRVVGKDPSEILGQLSANGQIYLVNSAGVYIGAGAEVNAAQFMASTFDVLDSSFLEKTKLTFQGNSDSEVVNLGKVHAETGDVFLIGKYVRNEGTLSAKKGAVALGSADEVMLKPSGSQRIFIKPSNETVDKKGTGVENSGKIEAVCVELRTHGNPYELAIKHSGEINAFGTETVDGEVFLVAEEGRVDFRGSAKARNLDASGGNVHLFGKELVIVKPGVIDVSGKSQGGTVLVGGDRGGKTRDIPNAKLVYMDQDTLIRANGEESGKGGKVILWADETNLFFGNIEAKGGDLSGDGGFVEVSSPGFFAPNGLTDTSAKNGRMGEFLLDPTNVTITDSSDSGIAPSPPPPNYTFSGTTATINVANLISNLNSNNVTIDATSGTGTEGNVEFKKPVIWNPSGATVLKVIAPTSIKVADGANIITTPSTNSADAVIQFFSPNITIGSENQTVPTQVTAESGKILFSYSDGDTPGTVTIAGGKSSGAETIVNAVTNELDLKTKDLIIKGGTASNTKGAINGGTGLNLDCTGSVQVSAGSGKTSPAQILSVSPGGNIYANISGDLILTGGSAVNTQATITPRGNLDLNVYGNITATGGSATNSNAEFNGPSHIYIGGFNTLSLTGGTVSGSTAFIQNYTPNSNLSIFGKNLNINAGSGDSAFISQPLAGTIKVDLSEDLSITSNNAHPAFIENNNGTIDVHARTVNLKAGTAEAKVSDESSGAGGLVSVNCETLSLEAEGGQALIGGQGNDLTVKTSGDCTLTAGNTANSRAILFNGVNGTTNISVGGNLTTHQGDGGGNIASIMSNSPSPCTVNVVGDLTFNGGGGNNGFSRLVVGTNPSVLTVNVGGDLNILPGTGNGANVGIYHTANQVGGLIDLTVGGHTNLMGRGNGSFAKIDNQSGETILDLSGALNLTGSDTANGKAQILSKHTISGSVLGAVMLKGGSGTNSEAEIISQDNIELEKTGRVSLTGGLSSATISAPSMQGSVDINACGSIELKGGTLSNGAKITAESELVLKSRADIVLGKNSSVIGGSGPVDIFSDQSILLSATSSVSSNSLFPIRFVVDHKRTNVVGRQGVIIDSDVSILNPGNGGVQLFTNARELNVMDSPINGASFVPDTNFLNTPQEQWNTFFPSRFVSRPFTFFYKSVTPSSILRIANILAFEFFYYEHLFENSMHKPYPFSIMYGDEGIKPRGYQSSFSTFNRDDYL